jgi:hypothetical protein
MDLSSVLVLFLRGLMAVALVAFTAFALSILWKDLRGEKIVKKKNKSSSK